jgi:hypothetical protein
MKKILLLPFLCGWCSAFAQGPSCTALATENAALKDKIAGYEARLGISANGVTVVDGDPLIKVKFVSCKASKATKRAVLTYQLLNSGEPLNVQIQTLNTQDTPSQVIDEQGQTYLADSDNYPAVGKQLQSIVPANVPFNGTLPFLDVPTTTTRLNSVVLSFIKTPANGGKQQYFKTILRNLPVTWGP